ncbi:RagB/SusD family nutrient uptake outer membrane protein [Terrimonas alba]|uniref:RagB/SusD family nutrient uptake outer membrane protein n=1 Tax=Terrimonas alba TaxID=3349636 RepID=UPI0035F31B26
MKISYLYISLCLLVTTGMGCKKYLEKEPDNRALVNTPEKVSQLLGTAYPQANYQAFAETMSDNVADIGNGGSDNVIHDPFYFIDTKENQQDSPEFYWYACYSAIAAANQALKVIGEASNPNDYVAQKGEALVARAYAHFMLVNFFSKFYDEATAGSSPGIPYVTEPEDVFVKQYDRKTVKEVYDMIEKDLLAGIPLIQDKIYKVPKYHFNKAAAYAFACRFYLFKKDYQKVVEYANLAIPGNNFASHLRGWNSSYKNITDVTELFKIYAKATENANLLLVETSSLWSRYYYTTRYGVDADKQARIFPRPDPLTGGNFAFALYSFGTDHKLVPKINEYFVKVSVNAEIGIPYVMVPLFTVEEVLFNRAEAYTYLGNTNAAIADLNTYASTRINNYSSTTHNITATKINAVFGTSDVRVGLIGAILYYKRAEFIHEGMRWFDILRYKLPVVHATSPDPSGNVTIIAELSSDDPRKVLQIPQSTSLSGLEPNPR